MRAQKQLPDDPAKHLVEFFGEYRDPLWDRMDEWKAEMDEIRNSIPELQQQVDNLQVDLAKQKRKTAAFDLYKVQDPNATNELSTKVIVQKLSGFAKFELDVKLTKLQFFGLIEETCSKVVDAGPPIGEELEGGEGEDVEGGIEKSKTKVFDKEKYEAVWDAYSKALGADAQTPPFAGNLEDPTYLAILEGMRNFNVADPLYAEAPAEEVEA